MGLGSILSPVGSILSPVANIASTLITNAANKQEQQDTRNWDLKMWNMQNAYNSPTAQMQRYQSAGLNPNLMYGGSTATSGNAGPVASVSPVNYRAPEIDLSQTVGLLSAFQDYLKNQEQTETQKYQTGIMKEQYKKAMLENYYQWPDQSSAPQLMYAKGKGNFLWGGASVEGDKEDRTPYFKKILDLNMSQQKAQIIGQNLGNTLRQQEAEIGGSLKPWNMTANDNIMLRLLKKTIDSIGGLGHDIRYDQNDSQSGSNAQRKLKSLWDSTPNW